MIFLYFCSLDYYSQMNKLDLIHPEWNHMCRLLDDMSRRADSCNHSKKTMINQENDNHMDWKRWRVHFEYENERCIQEITRECVRQAYQVFFEQYPEFRRIDNRYQFIYCPSLQVMDTRFKYYFGVDRCLHGWNMIGKALEDIYYHDSKPKKITDHFIYMIHYVKSYLESLLLQGKSVFPFIHRPVSSIYNELLSMDYIPSSSENEKRRLAESYQKKKINDWELYESEISVPGSLALCVMKKKSYEMERAVRQSKYSYLFRLIFQTYQDTTQTTSLIPFMTEDVMNTIENWLQQGKIRLSESVRAKLQVYDNRLQEIAHVYSLFPSHRFEQKDTMILLSENNQPISPLYPYHAIHYKGNIYQCIFQLIYDMMLEKVGMKRESIQSILCSNDFETKTMLEMDSLVCKQYVKWIQSKYKQIVKTDWEQKKSYFGYVYHVYHSQYTYPWHSDGLIAQIHERTVQYYIKKYKPTSPILPPTLFQTSSHEIPIDWKTFQSMERFIQSVSRLFRFLMKMKLCATTEIVMNVIHHLYPFLFQRCQEGTTEKDKLFFSCKWVKHEDINRFLNQCIETLFHFQLEIQQDILPIIHTMNYLYTLCQEEIREVFYESIVQVFVENPLREVSSKTSSSWNAYLMSSLRKGEIKQWNHMIHSVYETLLCERLNQTKQK